MSSCSVLVRATVGVVVSVLVVLLQRGGGGVDGLHNKIGRCTLHPNGKSSNTPAEFPAEPGNQGQNDRVNVLGLKKSGMDPPLCSSRACLPTAFIAFSVPFVCGWPLDVPQAGPMVLLPILPGLGLEVWASWFRALPPGRAALRTEVGSWRTCRVPRWATLHLGRVCCCRPHWATLLAVQPPPGPGGLGGRSAELVAATDRGKIFWAFGLKKC